MKQSVIFVFFSLYLCSSVHSEEFVCPTGNITFNDGIAGVLPIGATGTTAVPKGTNCTIKFDVPTGYAVRFEISSDYDASIGDYVRFDDSFFITPSNGTIEFGLAPLVSLEVFAISTKFTFFAKYAYVDLKKYTQTIVPTGDYFLATIAPMQYYTIKSAAGDTVSAKISMRDTGLFDQQIHDVFVFDGNDIVNSQFIGRLGDIYRDFEHSTQDTLSFVNLFESESNTFIMGNDYSKIEPYDNYRVLIVDSKKGFHGWMSNDRVPGLTAYTYICDGCNQFYINNMTFDMTIRNANEGFVEFRGMSPTQNLPIIVNYTAVDFSTDQLPLFIPSRMATAVLYDGSITVDVKTSEQDVVNNSENQSKGTIVSPTLWNPNDDASFNYTVSSETKNYFEFMVSFSKMVFSDANDKLEIQFSDENGNPTLQKVYDTKTTDYGSLKGSGATMMFTYSGSKNSQIVINYERTSMSTTVMQDLTGSSTPSMSTFVPTGSTTSRTSSHSTSIESSTSSPVAISSSSTIQSTTYMSSIQTSSSTENESSTISSQTTTTSQNQDTLSTSLLNTITSRPIPSTLSTINDISTSTIQTTTSDAFAASVISGIIGTFILVWNGGLFL